VPGLTLITPPATEPLTIAEAKTWLRIDAAGQEPAPPAPTLELADTSPSAGALSPGVYRGRCTFVTAEGETDAGPVSASATIADPTDVGRLAWTLPVGGAAVTGVNLYRTVADGDEFLLVATVENGTTAYVDNVADEALGLGAPTQNTTGDPLLFDLIQTVRHDLDGNKGRLGEALITQTWELALDGFPTCDQIVLPLPPLREVVSVTYDDANGDEQTMSADDYIVDTRSRRGRIVLKPGASWPAAGVSINSVRVQFVAGYGEACDLPAYYRTAMRLMLAYLWEHRGDDEALSSMPQAYYALIGVRGGVGL
jgi:uncharacterized phiE125 gp8 family phage protein